MGHILLNIGYIILGILLLVIPGTVLPWLCLAFSLVILLMGVYHLAAYFRHKEGRSIGSYCKLVGGAVAAALGVYALLRPQSVQLMLPIIFGLLVAVNGIARIETAIGAAKNRVQRWWAVLLLGLLSIVLGAALALRWQLPLLKGIDGILLSGILLVVEGALDLGCALYLRGVSYGENKAQPFAPVPAAEIFTPAPADTATAEPEATALPDQTAPELELAPVDTDPET